MRRALKSIISLTLAFAMLVSVGVTTGFAHSTEKEDYSTYSQSAVDNLLSDGVTPDDESTAKQAETDAQKYGDSFLYKDMSGGFKTDGTAKTAPAANDSYAADISTNVTDNAPVINHTPVTSTILGKDITISGTAIDADESNGGVVSVKLFYKQRSQTTYQSAEKSFASDSNPNGVLNADFSLNIPASVVTADAAFIDYYIQAEDHGNNLSYSGNAGSPNSIEVKEQTSAEAGENTTKNITKGTYPDLIITEAAVNSANYSATDSKGAAVLQDAYDAIEVYNTTDHAIDLKNYAVGYKMDYPTSLAAGHSSPSYSSLTSNCSQTTINQITKTSSYWGDTANEPSSLMLPSHGVAVLWDKYLPSGIATYENSTTDKKIYTDYTGLNYNNLASTYGMTSTDNAYLCEAPYASGGTLGPTSTGAKNFYMYDFNANTSRAWLFLVDKSAKISATKTDLFDGDVNKDNAVIKSASFVMRTDKNVDNGKSAELLYRPSDGLGYAKYNSTTDNTYNQTPSMGKIYYWQKPKTASDTAAPVVTNTTASSTSVADFNISANVTDDNDIRYIELYYKKDTDSEFTKVTRDLVAEGGSVAADLKSFALSQTIPSTVLKGAGSLQYYFNVTDGNDNVTNVGTAAMPNSVTVVDNNGPVISFTSPTQTNFVSKFDGSVAVSYTDESDVDATSVSMTLDSAPVDLSGTSITATGFTYSFAAAPITTAGSHTLSVTVKDKSSAANTATKSFTFNIISASSSAIYHTPEAVNSGLKPTKISAMVTDNNDNTVMLYYKNKVDANYSSVQMTVDPSTVVQGGGFTSADYDAEIPTSVFSGSGEVQYYIEAVNTTNSSDKMRLPTDSGTVFSYTLQYTSDLIVTEVMANAPNVASNDAYDAIEIYNASGRDLDLKDYAIAYKRDLYGSDTNLGLSGFINPYFTGINKITATSKFWGQTEPDKLILPKNKAAVIWVKYTASTVATNTDYTNLDINDFKAAFGLDDNTFIALAENPVTSMTVPIASNTAASYNACTNFYLVNDFNASRRGWFYIVKKNATVTANTDNDRFQIISDPSLIVGTGTFILTDNVTDGKATQLGYDYSNGYTTTNSQFKDVNQTFGKIYYWQKPKDGFDKTKPVISHTPLASAGPDKINIVANLSDDTDVRVGRVYYRVDGGAWKTYEKDFVLEDSTYSTSKALSFTVPSNEALGKSTVDYYIEAIDGNSNSITEGTADKPFSVAITDTDGPTINITSPSNNATFEGNFIGSLTASISDITGLDNSSIKIAYDNTSIDA
ncbi:MAG: hypothetical protein Q8865_07920, partial [Bacillota bacterium]|nr:hypothetical protein [Bacillota bacterium]